MIDYDDVGWVALLGPGGFIGLILVIIVLCIAASNDSDCSKMKCERGTPTLMNHDCLCVEKAK